MTTAHAFHAAPATSTAGLILSLASALPRNARTLERRAKALASRLARPHARSLDARASDLLAELLTVADGDTEAFAEDGCIDSDFDDA